MDTFELLMDLCLFSHEIYENNQVFNQNDSAHLLFLHFLDRKLEKIVHFSLFSEFFYIFLRHAYKTVNVRNNIFLDKIHLYPVFFHHII